MKAIPKDGSKADENDDRKDEIIQKLSDKGGNVGTHRIRELAVRIFSKRHSDGEIQKIIEEELKN